MQYKKDMLPQRKPRDPAAALIGLKFTLPCIHYKFNSRQALKAQASELETYWRKTEFNANVD